MVLCLVTETIECSLVRCEQGTVLHLILIGISKMCAVIVLIYYNRL